MQRQASHPDLSPTIMHCLRLLHQEADLRFSSQGLFSHLPFAQTSPELLAALFCSLWTADCFFLSTYLRVPRKNISALSMYLKIIVCKERTELEFSFHWWYQLICFWLLTMKLPGFPNISVPLQCNWSKIWIFSPKHLMLLGKRPCWVLYKPRGATVWAQLNNEMSVSNLKRIKIHKEVTFPWA